MRSLPMRLRAHGHGPFVGRQRELSRLEHAIAAGSADGQRCALVTGEAGIGKSRLVAELAAQAHDAGRLVLAGRCDEGLGLAYQPFAEALAQLADQSSDEMLREHVRGYGDAIVRMVPSLMVRGIATPGDMRMWTSDTDRYVMYAAIEDLLAEAARECGPILLVLEDLHWADEPSILLLRRLIASPRVEHLFVLGTLRIDELGDDAPQRALLADLHREPGAVRVDLTGLRGQSVLELIAATTGLEPEALRVGFANAVGASTGGNPFFVIELVLNLKEMRTSPIGVDRLDLVDGAGRFVRLPHSINDTVRRRVERLGDDVYQCLMAAAVIGDEFDLELAHAVAEVENVADATDRAVRAGLLIDVSGERPRLRFSHSLVRHCLYGDLGVTRRGELHRRAALTLERRITTGRVTAAELAGHWLAAASGTAADADKPIRYAALAGDDALARLAPDEACRWFRVAVERLSERRPTEETELYELLISLGEAERRAGRSGFRDTLLEAARLARVAGHGDALVRAAIANTRGLQSATGVVDTDRVETLAAAIDAVGDAHSVERAQLLALRAAELTFQDRHRCVELSDEAVAIARGIGDPTTLSIVLALRFVTIWAPETHAERMRNTAEALVASERLDDPIAAFHAAHWRTVACIEGGEIDEARRFIARGRALADSLRQPTTLWLVTGDEANLALIEGRLGDAERLALEAFEAGQGSEPDAFACYTAQLTAILAEKGALGPLVPVIEQVVADNPGIPGFRSTLALALCDAGDHERARSVLTIDAGSAFGELPADATWLAVACIFARAAARLSDAPAARALRELLEPWHDMIACPGWGPWGPVSLYLGGLAAVLDDLEGAEHHLHAAERRASRSDAPIWRARAQLGLAGVHARRGETATARELLATALETAELHHAEGLAGDARAGLEVLSRGRA